MIKGYNEVHNALSALPKAFSDKVWSDINYDRSKIVTNQMKLNAPEGPTGNLVDSIGAVRMRGDRLGTVWVGPRRRGRYKGFAGHLVEYGTKNRQTRSGANRGIMPKKPFAEKSFLQTRGELENALTKSAEKVVSRTLRKYL
jgi:bacteriophage HK97-gp10 putative tail-component